MAHFGLQIVLLVTLTSYFFVDAVDVIDAAQLFDAFTIYPGQNAAKITEYLNKTNGLFFYDHRKLESAGSIQFETNSSQNQKQGTSPGNGLTVFGIPLQDESQNGRQNRTCFYYRQYACQRSIRQQYRTVCLRGGLISPCTRHRIAVVNSTCQETYTDCCEGEYVGSSGYCQTLRAEGRCGNPLLTNYSGVLTSPSYPSDYEPSQNCEWMIAGPPNHRVILTVTNLDMEGPTSLCNLRLGHCFHYCQYDKLEIGGLAGATHTKSLCGKRVPRISYLSSGARLDISFMSDETNAGRGFRLIYNIVPVSSISQRRCNNGRHWKLCHRKCALTCESLAPKSFGVWPICMKSDGSNSVVDVSELNDITCKPGCVCPDDKPVWYRNRCVKMEECPQSRFRCGIPIEKPTPMIIGGATARDGAWPWMVQITTNGMISDCGATLVCSDWVVTAAHCFLDKNTWSMPNVIDKDAYWFHLGKYWKYTQGDDRKVESFRARKIIVHPSYNFKKDHNDIALVQLESHVIDIDRIRPICLPDHLGLNIQNEGDMNSTQASPNFDDTCMVTGWGTTRFIGPNPYRLKELRMPVKPASQCEFYKSYVWRLMICAGGEINEDTCKGDSGGPFMCKRNNRWFLDGITSFGDDCGTIKPGGYTRVANYIPWIRVTIGAGCGT